MTARSIRRAAERRAQKLARKAARQAETPDLAAAAAAINPVEQTPSTPILSNLSSTNPRCRSTSTRSRVCASLPPNFLPIAPMPSSPPVRALRRPRQILQKCGQIRSHRPHRPAARRRCRRIRRLSRRLPARSRPCRPSRMPGSSNPSSTPTGVCAASARSNSRSTPTAIRNSKKPFRISRKMFVTR